MKKLTAAAALAAVAFGGCAAETSNGNKDQSGKLGSVEAALTLPGGLVINTVNFEVEDSADATVASGSMDVTNSSRIEFQVGNLPIANDYEMILAATTVPAAGQEALDCAGTAEFDITSNGVTSLTMSLVCQGDIAVDVDERGDIRVTVNVTQEGDYSCPVPTGISALPAETEVNSTLQLEGFLSSAADSVAWSGMGGTFGSASALATSFTCGATPGVYSLTLTASKERCADTLLAVTVECSGEAPDTEVSCTDNLDNDLDGALDCDDSDCAGNAACVPEADCDDTVDNDLDGDVDCADSDCAASPECDVTPPPDACMTCLDTACESYEGLNLSGPCFNEDPNGLNGPVSQPVFSQLCTDAVECSSAAASNCFLDSIGPAQCYCGEQTIDQCNAAGPIAGAPCVAEWTAATECTGIADAAARNSCVLGAFQDLSRPSGYAFFVSLCAQANGCSDECTN